MFFQARYYSPAVGRFLSADTIVPDPSNPQSLNRYAYVLNDPVKYTDPTGHDRDCGLMDRSCDDLRDEYRNSDWQKHLGFKQFTAAKDAYAYYMSNPQAAFQEGWIEDADSYMWARIYSEDVRHEWFNPLNDNFLAGKMQEAREGGDIDQWYMIAIAFGISEWMSDRFGGGGGSGLPHRPGRTVAVLEADGNQYVGISGCKQIDFPVNSISADHAEIDALNQLYRGRQVSGITGGEAAMTVSRVPCVACDKYGGIRSGVEATGLNKLTVTYPRL